MTDVEKKRNQTWEILSEEKSFTWKIENFQTFLTNNPEFNDVFYLFDAGDTIALPTKWKLYLLKNQKHEVGIYMQLQELPDGMKKVYATFGYNTSYRMDKLQFPTQFTIKDEGKGWSNGIFYNCKKLIEGFDLRLDDGHLLIKVNFTLFKDLIVDGETREFKRIKLQHDSCDALIDDLQQLLDSGKNADITIETSDGKSLKAHRAILATRCPVFFAMFQHDMTESATRVVRVEDLTLEGMKEVLQFIYTGKVGDKWEESVEEIVYGANKYGLLPLLDFCDKNLASTCKTENAWSLLRFAQLHELKTAEGEIAEYIALHAKEVIQAEKSALAKSLE